MKKRTLIIALLILAPVSAFVSFLKWGGDEPAGAEAAQKKAARYTCPMHPNYVVDKPGDCPVCGMSLVLVEEEEAAEPAKPADEHAGHTVQGGGHEGHVQPQGRPEEARPQGTSAPGVEGRATLKVSPEKQQLVGVKTAPVETRDTSRVIRTVGRVAYDPELYYAQQEYLSSLKSARKAKGSSLPAVEESALSLVEASKTRLKLMGLSEAQIESLGKQGTPDRSLLLPKDGKSAWIYASIYESDAPYVTSGLTASITIPSDPGAGALKGKVTALDPVFNEQTRSLNARILVENCKDHFKPQAYVNVEIQLPLGTQLVIPADAVINTGTRTLVYVDRGNGVLEPREVTIGARMDGLAAVQSGLAKGEQVVTNANFLIDSESQLKATMQGAGGGHKH